MFSMSERSTHRSAGRYADSVSGGVAGSGVAVATQASRAKTSQRCLQSFRSTGRSARRSGIMRSPQTPQKSLGARILWTLGHLGRCAILTKSCRIWFVTQNGPRYQQFDQDTRADFIKGARQPAASRETVTARTISIHNRFACLFVSLPRHGNGASASPSTDTGAFRPPSSPSANPLSVRRFTPARRFRTPHWHTFCLVAL
jgi:hypothetical protein